MRYFQEKEFPFSKWNAYTAELLSISLAERSRINHTPMT
jgi:hypothetical protein